MYPYVITDQSVTIFIDDKAHTIHSSVSNYEALVSAIRDKDLEDIRDQVSIAKQINAFGEGHIIVKHGVVLYKGMVVDNSLTKRILQMRKDGFDINPMCNFLDNLMDNPSNSSVNDLYNFLENNNLPITEDGYFLAYKNVSEDYKDHRTGTLDNSVGKVVSMPRNQVNEDSKQTCSYGLHVCSKEYLDSMWGYRGKTVLVKVNPRDVVAVPYDYNNSKMRVCQYQVIKDITEGAKEHGFEDSVYGDDNWDYTPDE